MKYGDCFILGAIAFQRKWTDEGIAPGIYYKWSKVFLAAGKRQLSGATVREANRDEVADPWHENEQLKQLVAELSLKKTVY